MRHNDRFRQGAVLSLEQMLLELGITLYPDLLAEAHARDLWVCMGRDHPVHLVKPRQIAESLGVRIGLCQRYRRCGC